MIENLPIYIPVLFTITLLLTLTLFFKSISVSSWSEHKYLIYVVILGWLGLQGVLSYKLVYLDSVKTFPPMFAYLGFIPMFIGMAIIFFSKKGKSFIQSLSLYQLTMISIVRIPVEIVLWRLYVEGQIPELMTFEGRNFDILAGLSAPIIAYFGYKKKTLNKSILLAWNVLSILLLVNIVGHAILSFPTTFQQLAFDQPNVGILYFPFFWLPSFIVPVVFFTHFVSIFRIRKENWKDNV
jgi:hypothetical protein